MNNKKGFTLLFITITILSISSIIAAGLSYLTINSFYDAQNKIKSAQSYYASEAGIEDYIYRLKQNMQTPSSNTLTIDNSSATIQMSELIGNSRTITSRGDTDNRIRKTSAVYTVTTDQISFYYGAQAGERGIEMGNGSIIQGNVFSNGAITGSGNITGTAIVSNNNEINGISIGEDAYAYSCVNSNITNTLYSLSDGSITNCDYDSLEIISEIASSSMPIDDAQINDWKNDAITGGTISGDYILAISETQSLGPIKITGNMILNNNSTLNITGIIYVEGNIITNNNTTLKLDSNFGSNSGIILSDGKINIQNNVNIQGSGTTGSYIMLLSTNNSLDNSDPAIDIYNNAQGAVFYTTAGLIRLHNNISVREATGYKLSLDNNATISYESGLSDMRFTSGTGGSWGVELWQEIE
ncbi:hypothetical protein ACFLZ0_03075 [Patescibacteria group bacterium]